MVDENKIAMRPAVELSYLSSKEQVCLHEFMELTVLRHMIRQSEWENCQYERKKDVAGNMLETARAYAELTDELMVMYRELSTATCKIN